MRDGSSVSGAMVGYCGLVTIMIGALKVCNVIALSWLWVTAPLWGSILVVLLLVTVVLTARWVRGEPPLRW